MESGRLIAIFCNSFPPEGGGAAVRIYNLACLLRDAGYRVHVICAMPNYPTGKIFPAYRGKLTADEVVDGIAVRRVWLSPSNSASALARGWSMASFVLSLKLLAFRRIRKMQPALVIISSPPLPMAASAVRYFRKHSYKVLLNVSDIWPLSASALGAMNESRLYARLESIATQMYKSADAVTTQSGETLEHIRQHCGIMPPAMLYRNLPAEAYDATTSAWHREAHRPIIVYPGLLGHAQALVALCSAIDFNALGAELHIYGEGAEFAPLKDFIARNPGRGLLLREPVPAEALAEVFRSANAVLVPLAAPIEGALPSKLFTAAQHGVPVLYSGGGEGERLVREYDLGWTAAPGDYSRIAVQISELAAMQPEEQILWRERIRGVAETQFNKSAQDAVFLSFLQRVIA